MSRSATIYRGVCLLLILGQLAITAPVFTDWLAGRPAISPTWYASRLLGAMTFVSLMASLFIAVGHTQLEGRRRYLYYALLALAAASLLTSLRLG